MALEQSRGTLMTDGKPVYSQPLSRNFKKVIQKIQTLVKSSSAKETLARASCEPQSVKLNNDRKISDISTIEDINEKDSVAKSHGYESLELTDTFIYPTAQTQVHVSRQWLEDLSSALVEKLAENLARFKQGTGLSVISHRKQKKIQQAMAILTNKIMPIYEKETNEAYFSVDDLKLLSLYFESLSRLIPCSTERELTKLINIHLLFDWSRFTKFALYENKVEALDILTKPGSSLGSEKSVYGVAGLSLIPVMGISQTQGPFVEGKFGFIRKNQRRSNDENKIYKDKLTTKSAVFNLGCQWGISKLAEAGITGGVQLAQANTKWKKWKNVRHYVYAKGQKVCWDNRHFNSTNNKFEKIRHKINCKLGFYNELAKFKKYQEAAENSIHRLNELTEHYLCIPSKISVPIVERIKPIKGKTKSYIATGQMRSEIGATFGEVIGFNAGAKLISQHEYKQTKKQEREPHPLWKQNTANALANMPAYIYQSINERLTENPQAADIIHVLSTLQQKINTYIEIVQKYDYAKSNRKLKDVAKELRDKKHQLENEQGAIGRHVFLQFAACQLTFLSYKIQTIKDKFSHAQSVSSEISTHAKDAWNDEDSLKVDSLMKDIGALLTHPQIVYSKSKLDKATCVNRHLTKRYRDNTSKIMLDFPFFKGELTILNRWRDYYNHLRAGRYCEYEIAGFFNPELQHELSGVDLASAIKNVASNYGYDIPLDFNLLPNLGLESKVGLRTRYFLPEYTQSSAYRGNKDWQHIWTRNITNKGVDINTGGLMRFTVYPGVNLGADIGLQSISEVVTKETIGTRSLIQPAMLFNRYYLDAGKKTNNLPWYQFKKEHRAELHAILKHIHQKEANLTSMLDFWKQLLITYASQYSQEFTVDDVEQKFSLLYQTCQEFDSNSNHSNDTQFKQAMIALENIFILMTTIWEQEKTSFWKWKDYKMTRPNKTSTKLLLKLGVHPRLKMAEMNNGFE